MSATSSSQSIGEVLEDSSNEPFVSLMLPQFKCQHAAIIKHIKEANNASLSQAVATDKADLDGALFDLADCNYRT